MFIPELPGYGLSSLPPRSDKRTVGRLVMEALQTTFGKDRKVIWCGHDRGGRIGHRLVVDDQPDYNIIAAIFLDIVPTWEQWKAFANPKASVAYWHWPFLAMPMAPSIIESIGGGNLVRTSLEKIKGSNPMGTAKFKEHDAFDHYAALFSKPETIAGSCADYMAGANEDVEEQKQDQKEGRKVKIPTLVGYSSANLGRMHDVDALWRNWAEEGSVKSVGVGEGYGHFLPEGECSELPMAVSRVEANR